jgi:hypothetical protein
MLPEDPNDILLFLVMINKERDSVDQEVGDHFP